ncbi:sugar phosphate isomerase/epimerase family protein [Paenibacillus sp. Soil724D2]|uniref:sugar phosphate isomerase/epimerase family protein n=1 Tax=Paenibacillus sp. (strain Soil724D2) TaxID=1736392 RepID=UPI0007146BC3|nr:TIM barrel protein [Paenibacillus sp. Soil724D2]KRE36482.1 xylose isomerase [Paenibacillus sp. Soil724D2]
MLKMKVSCHLITWEEDFVKGMEEASSLGFPACETFTRIALKYEDRIHEFKALFEQHDLVLSALYGGGRFSDPMQFNETVAYNTRVAKFAALNGSDRIVLGPRGPRTAGGTTLEELKIAARAMNESAKRCYDLGVKACVHPHLHTELQNENELDAIMEMTDPNFVFFCPDTAHLTKAGMDPVTVMRRYKDRIAYMHIKDVTPDDPDRSKFPVLTGDEALPIFCELGLGTIDFPAVVRLLEEIHYDGWMTIEIDQSTSTPLNSLKVCRDYVEQKLGVSVRNRI